MIGMGKRLRIAHAGLLSARSCFSRRVPILGADEKNAARCRAAFRYSDRRHGQDVA